MHLLTPCRLTAFESQLGVQQDCRYLLAVAVHHHVRDLFICLSLAGMLAGRVWPVCSRRVPATVFHTPYTLFLFVRCSDGALLLASASLHAVGCWFPGVACGHARAHVHVMRAHSGKLACSQQVLSNSVVGCPCKLAGDWGHAWQRMVQNPYLPGRLTHSSRAVGGGGQGAAAHPERDGDHGLHLLPELLPQLPGAPPAW